MKTLAVVVGNNGYYDPNQLKNAVNDAQSIAESFVNLGYEVKHYSNCTSVQCGEILSYIDSEIVKYDATIFFFAGHGFQMDGENYLTSVECQIPPVDKHNCRRNSITLSELLDIYKRHPNKINIVIIDACRKNFGRGNSEAFAPMQAPQGTLIAFSTSPDEGAKDGGFEEHSIYTGALLKYIGREMLSVEELFKKVRKTVYTLTGGSQTPWEHTSLIGDFYFNTGQMVHSPQLPYVEDVVKDANFVGKNDDFTALINEVKMQNWHIQNPAFNKLIIYRGNQLNKDQQFILGRNLLQACETVFNAQSFFEDLKGNLSKYNSNGENHVLNGILFEIYFDSRGEFRKDNFKLHCFEKIMALRKMPIFKQSFYFIAQLLSPFQEFRTFWIPTSEDTPMDIDIQVTSEIVDDKWKGKIKLDIIHTIKVMSTDITDRMQHYDLWGKNSLKLKNSLANYLAVPLLLINIHSNCEINKIAFLSKNQDNDDF